VMRLPPQHPQGSKTSPHSKHFLGGGAFLLISGVGAGLDSGYGCWATRRQHVPAYMLTLHYTVSASNRLLVLPSGPTPEIAKNNPISVERADTPGSNGVATAGIEPARESNPRQPSSADHPQQKSERTCFKMPPASPKASPRFSPQRDSRRAGGA
jgi:hypothetical protein